MLVVSLVLSHDNQSVFTSIANTSHCDRGSKFVVAIATSDDEEVLPLVYGTW